MESYKHSCPLCGQHIEYTDEYCGKRVTCPSCGSPVTFPALPPGGRRKPLKLKKAEVVQRARWSFSLPAILAFLREFEHWNMVWAGLVPFLVVTALVIGALVVKKKAGENPAAPAAPLVQADPNAWQQMTNLAKADKMVEDQLAVVNQYNAAVLAARRDMAALDARYKSMVMDKNSSYNRTREYQAATQAMANADAAFAAAKRRFEDIYSNYQKSGGTVDYRRQLPP